jgi:hypothetical protein
MLITAGMKPLKKRKGKKKTRSMAFLTESEVRERAAHVTQRMQKAAGRVPTEDRASVHDAFDIFLSHSSAEPEEVLLGIKAMLEDADIKVYVDKFNDPQLSPNNVTPQTAEILRARMRQSQTLLYVYSPHSVKSRWMPWELGFFDGYKGRVGIVPVTRNQEEYFMGEEYLNLYPHVDRMTTKQGIQKLWINRTSDEYAPLYEWAKGTEQIRKHA